MPYIDVLIPSLPFSEPTTSRDAALAIQPVANEQGERYFRWLQARGAYGATDLEAERIPMKRQSICARRGELVAQGRIVKTDLRRDGCAVWIAVRA